MLLRHWAYSFISHEQSQNRSICYFFHPSWLYGSLILGGTNLFYHNVEVFPQSDHRMEPYASWLTYSIWLSNISWIWFLNGTMLKLSLHKTYLLFCLLIYRISITKTQIHKNWKRNRFDPNCISSTSFFFLIP